MNQFSADGFHVFIGNNSISWDEYREQSDREMQLAYDEMMER